MPEKDWEPGDRVDPFCNKAFPHHHFFHSLAHTDQIGSYSSDDVASFMGLREEVEVISPSEEYMLVNGNWTRILETEEAS